MICKVAHESFADAIQAKTKDWHLQKHSCNTRQFYHFSMVLNVSLTIMYPVSTWYFNIETVCCVSNIVRILSPVQKKTKTIRQAISSGNEFKMILET